MAEELTRKLAERLDASANSYTDDDRQSALVHFIDGLSTAHAGYRRPEMKMLLASQIVHTGTRADTHAAWLIGRHLGQLRARPIDAALLNAMAAHLDDFDDDETSVSIAHVTVPTLTATLAAAAVAAEGHDISGKRVLDSFLSGVETMVALGALLNPEHYHRGWHSTATLGVFGAAVAAAHVLGLSPRQKATALSFAVTACSGTRSAFGSSAKPWQVAAAARDGVEAALLARAGLDTNAVIFGWMGLAELYGAKDSSNQKIDSVFARIGQGSPFVDPGVTIKAYPCCTAAHTAIEACEILRRDGRLGERRQSRLDGIAAIDVFVEASIPAILIHNTPSTALEGKFSMQFCVAAALCSPSMGLEVFTDTTLADPTIQAMMARVKMHPVPGQKELLKTDVRVQLVDGRVVSESIAEAKGSPARPFTREDIQSKFASLCPMADTGSTLEHLYGLPAAQSWQSFQGRLSSLLNVATTQRESKL